MGELLERMPSSEFTLWGAWLQEHHLPDELVPQLLAQLVSALTGADPYELLIPPQITPDDIAIQMLLERFNS